MLKGFFLNVLERNKEKIVAVCDEELLGKEFREGERRLKVKKSFYKGEKVREEKVRKKMGEATILNLVGKKSVSIGIELGLIKKENVLEIGGIKHAQMCTFKV